MHRSDKDLSNPPNIYRKKDLGQQLNNTLDFNPHDPFPLLAEDSYSYEAAKSHSCLVDEWLGFPLVEPTAVPQALAETQTWSHLTTQQFQTPYCEIRNILSRLNPAEGETLVDLGCGYARMAFVLAKHYPRVSFKGYEVDAFRVQLAKEKFIHHGIQNSEIFLQDIVAPEFKLPRAAYYFLFDFGHKESIQEILKRLKLIAQSQSIQVVGRGRATRHYIQELHPWLSQVNEPQHATHYSIYKS